MWLACGSERRMGRSSDMPSGFLLRSGARRREASQRSEGSEGAAQGRSCRGGYKVTGRREKML